MERFRNKYERGRKIQLKRRREEWQKERNDLERKDGRVEKHEKREA